jgi:hypothetical protein
MCVPVVAGFMGLTEIDQLRRYMATAIGPSSRAASVGADRRRRL